MSDQAQSASITGATGAADPAPAAPVFGALDMVDQIKNLNDRLSALESKPAGDFTSEHKTFLARVIKQVFGETVE